MRFVMDSNPRHAKFAARLVACMKDSGNLCEQVIEVRDMREVVCGWIHAHGDSLQSIAESLEGVLPDRLVAHIAVLAQLSLRAPDAFEQKSDVIMTFLVKQVLRSSLADDEDMVRIY